MLYSSILTSGPNNYLYAIRRVKEDDKGFMDNVFIRVSSLKEKKFTFHKGIMYNTSSSEFVLKYDPDVAVSKSVPPLFLPYILNVAQEAFADGYDFLDRHFKNRRLWTCAPLIVWLIVLLGWMILPVQFYSVLIGIYLLIILIDGISYFNPVSVPFFVIGMLLDHFTRALVFPAGLIKRIIKGK